VAIETFPHGLIGYTVVRFCPTFGSGFVLPSHYRQRQWHTYMRHLLISSGHVYFHPHASLTLCIIINPLSTSLPQHNIVPHFHHCQHIARHGFRLSTPIVLDISFDTEFSSTTITNDNGEHMEHAACIIGNELLSRHVVGYVSHQGATIPGISQQDTSSPDPRAPRRYA